MESETQNEDLRFCVTFSRLLYPKQAEPGYAGFMLVQYNIQEEGKKNIPKKYGGDGVKTLVTKGNGLPITPRVKFSVVGHWTVYKEKRVLEVDDIALLRINTEEGVIGFLSCGIFKGMTKPLARRVWETFGENTLEILDTDIDRLLEVPKMTENKFNKFKDSYLINMGCRRLAKELTPFGINGFQIQQFFDYSNKDEENALNRLHSNPYLLCNYKVPFETADAIARKYKLSPEMPERIREAVNHALKRNEIDGNTCGDPKTICLGVCKICGFPATAKYRDIIIPVIQKMMSYNDVVSFGGSFFSKETAKIEGILAGRICRNLKNPPDYKVTDIDNEIKTVEEELGLTFAEMQIEAVKMALADNNSFCIITGGPGTGKTLIQKAIIRIFSKQNPNAKILCCSPTGKAARRMTESTGYPAQTIHSALGLHANEMGDFNEPVQLSADLIVVDEVSMLDTFIAASLFDSTRNGCRVIFVGDCDQLPSVGAGCVLHDLLETGKIPSVMLNCVFRQSADSYIAINAHRIKEGNTNLKGTTAKEGQFRFVLSSNLKKSQEILTEEYLNAVKNVGLDGVALLSPFRKNGETCVNEMNNILQARINPDDGEKMECEFRGLTFREGDRVMQNKNYETVANGEIGTIQRIFDRTEDGVKERVVLVKYEETEIEYLKDDLKMLDLAYCTTIHKSQGSEYHTVIISLQNVHSIMLNRPLIYTAITRGKKNVVIVGEPDAVRTAITTNDTTKRQTRLKERIIEKMQ